MLRIIRILLFNRRKFTLYMRSGNVLRFTAKADDYRFTNPGMNEKSWQYTFDRMKPYFNIDWSQVEAVQVD